MSACMCVCMCVCVCYYFKDIQSLKTEYYGLCQSPGCWNVALDCKLKEMGFQQAPSDPCLHVSKEGEMFFVFFHEKVKNKNVEIVYCPTEDMIADMLTKGLSQDKFKKLPEIIGIREWKRTICLQVRSVEKPHFGQIDVLWIIN